MKICIPSYKRAGNVSTYKIIPNSYIVIPESQYKDYSVEYDKKRIITIPDDRDGNVAKKRNAILDLVEGDEVFMIDDDLIRVKEVKSGKEIRGEDFISIIESGFRIIRELGLHYFGFNWNNQPLHNNPSVPFSFNKRFYGGFGIIKNELRYNEGLTRLEDTDFWLQQTRKDKATFRFNNIHIQCKMKQASQKGGIEEKEDSLEAEGILLKRWGTDVLKYSKKKELLASSPYKGI